MITLALFRKMAEDGVAGLVKDRNFFWEEMPLQKNGKPAAGVWIVTRSGSSDNSPTGLNLKATVDFYVAMANKAETELVHSEILDYLMAHPCFCSLTGTVGAVSYSLSNIRVRPTTTPENSGVTENGLIVKMASAQLTYDKVNNKKGQ